MSRPIGLFFLALLSLGSFSGCHLFPSNQADDPLEQPLEGLPDGPAANGGSPYGYNQAAYPPGGPQAAYPPGGPQAAYPPGGPQAAYPPAQYASYPGGQPAQPQMGQASFTLEVHALNGKTKMHRLPLRGPTYAQQVLEQTKLTGKFRDMQIQMMRGAGNDRHKMDMEYSPSKKKLNPLYDYLLRPGDHLIIMERSNSKLDQLMDSFANPLGRRKQRR